MLATAIMGVIARQPKAWAGGWELRGNALGHILEVDSAGIIANSIYIANRYNQGIYLSKDFGHTWETLLARTDIEQIKPLKTRQNILVKTPDEIFKFNLNTRELQNIPAPHEIDFSQMRIVEAYENEALINLNGKKLGIWDLKKSTLNILWNESEDTLIDVWANRNLKTLVVQTKNIKGVQSYISANKGATWKEIENLKNVRVRDVAFTNNYAFVLTRDIGIAIVDGLGHISRWVSPADGKMADEIDLAGDTLIVTSREPDSKVNIYISQNLGETWENTNFWSGQASLSFGYGLSLRHYWDGYQLTEVLIHPYLGMFALPIEKQNRLKPLFDKLWKGQKDGELEARITAYFDHAYPLLGTSRIQEPKNTADTTTNYKGRTATEPELYYSGHNGIDFGLPYGTEIVAPQKGWARRINCYMCGNTILIEHDDGYKTIYMHLQEKDLVTKSYNGTSIEQGETLGRVGMSGNTTGPHLHFSVIRPDSRGRRDNTPNLVDPFGWQDPNTLDPWELFGWTDSYGAEHGARSSYLWKEATKNYIAQYKGESTNISWENLNVQIPSNFVAENATIEIAQSATPPNTHVNNKIYKALIGTSFQINCVDITGKFIHKLQKAITLRIKIPQNVLADVDPKTLDIYHLINGDWQKLQGNVNTTTLVVTGDTSTLSTFAVFGEKLTQEMPQTTVRVVGNIDENGWFAEYPEIQLISNDTNNITFVSLGNDIWEEYHSPIKIREDGISKIYYRGLNALGDVEPTQELWLYVNVARKPIDVLHINPIKMKVKQ